MTRRHLYLALGTLLMFGANAGAQTAAAPPGSAPWGTVLVPGGFSALGQATQLSGPAEDWRTIPLIIELSFAGLDGVRYTRNISVYGALLRKLHRLATAISPDRTVSLADRQNRRAEFDDLLETLGLEYDSTARRVRLRGSGEVLATSTLLEAAGLVPRDLLIRLNAGEKVSVATVDSNAPLPLGAAYWEGRFEPAPPPHDLLFAILSSREMSSLYYGLLGLDDETLLSVQADARLAASLVRHALVLPAVADALRIERGQVVPPGGAGIASAWQDLIGERLDRPSEFVEDLLRADEGRLAHFYRTLWALPTPTVHWIVGGHAEQGNRSRALRRAYDAFSAPLQGWRADAMIPPPAFGPDEVLAALSIRNDGTMAGPLASGFWRKVFESSDWPSAPEREMTRIDSTAVDAAGLLGLVCPAACDRDRLGVVTLIQHEFPDPPATLPPQLFAVGRSRLRYPTLALEIERMRLGEASSYAALGSLASRIDDLDGAPRALALVQYQSAIVLLARLRAVGAPVAFVAEHLRALSALPVTRNGFEGGLVRWMVRLFTVTKEESLNYAAARMLAGQEWLSAGPAFEWEGLTYRVDIAATETARIREALANFTANTLEDAAALLRLSDEMPNRVAAGETEAFVAAVGETLAAATDVTSVWWAGVPIQFESFSELASIGRNRSFDKRAVERSVVSLRAAADLAGADALASLVYALALRNVEGELALSRELPRRHHLVPAPLSGSRATAWAVPTERYPDRGTRYISGSLLAMDVGIPLLAARRLAASRPSTEPNMSPVLATGLLRTAVLTAPWTIRSEDLTTMQEAHARGTALVEKWTTNGNGSDHITEAGLAGARAGWLRWSARRGDRPRHVDDLTGLVRLGGLQPVRRTSWGAAQSPTACLCEAIPALALHAQSRPRDPEAVATTFVEASIRVALELRQRDAPAALAPGVLMLVMSDVIDSALLPHPTDSRGLIAAVERIPSLRFDDYIAAVAARGPLVRIGDDSRENR